jgi:hypothetical protein
MLAQARLNSAVSYLKSNVNISDFYLQKENLEEDWDRLYEILQTSDIPYKAEVLDIIKTKSWGSRKLALQKLDGGRVWRLLEKEYFPALRCVRFAIFCKWDPSKPYLTAPAAQPAYTPYSSPVAHPTPMVHPSPVVQPTPAPQAAPVVKEIYREIIHEIVRDTVYIRDTVRVKVIIHKRDTIYILREQIANAESLFSAPAPTSAAPAQTSYVPQKAKSQPYLHDTPWMMGIKTNLLTDAMAIPMAGLEFQIARSVSLDLSGWCTTTNIFNKQDENTNFYGFSPELRWWIGNNTMRKGSFVGLTSTIAWYTLQWKDGLLYQNGPENVWQDNTHDPGNSTPAWSAGMVYGYSLGLGRKAHWGLEFYVGIGYAKYRQNTAAYNGNIWEYIEHQNKNHFGLTKAGINLAYRFSTRKVKPEYYE